MMIFLFSLMEVTAYLEFNPKPNFLLESNKIWQRNNFVQRNQLLCTLDNVEDSPKWLFNLIPCLFAHRVFSSGI